MRPWSIKSTSIYLVSWKDCCNEYVSKHLQRLGQDHCPALANPSQQANQDKELKMTANDWSTYIGVIGGSIGTLTGVGGFVLSIFTFRRTAKLKALDLRLELRSCERQLRSDARELMNLLRSAQAQRLQDFAHRGMRQSSAQAQWLATWKDDHAHAESIVKQVAALDAAGSGAQANLESKLNAARDLQHQLTTLSGKYRVTR